MIVLRALGTSAIDTGVTTLTPSQEIVFAAALYLILERSRPVSRSTLASLLWPEVPEKARAHRLRQTILQLKKLGILVSADRNNVQLLEHDVQCDVDELSPPDSTRALRHDSLGFLPGFNPRLSEAVRDWVDSKREEVNRTATKLLVRELERSRHRADWASVEKNAAKCLTLDAFNETAVLAQAEAAAMQGGKWKAVSILDRYIADVGGGRTDLRLPASLLRRRVAERIPDRTVLLNSDIPFVGREREMEILTRHFERARAGQGSATLIVGEPGIGKTRLSAELGRFAELQGALVQRFTCRRSDVDRPLSLFVDIVPSLREMPGALGCSPETLTALKRLTRFDQPSDDKSHTADSELLFQNLRAALFDLVDSVAGERCLVILLEDIQWLDDVSTKLLAGMVEWCADRSLYFVLNSRPSPPPPLNGEICNLEAMILSPLEATPSIALLQSVAVRPSDKLDSEFIDWCLSVAEGSPFFLQELAHQWIETGVRHEAPLSLTKVLQERLSRLSEPALRMLQSCAVLGDHATLNRVAKVLEYPPYRLLSAVEELSNAAMLRGPMDASDSPVEHLQPRHDFLASVAMGCLSSMSVAFMHGRSADVLENEFTKDTMPTALLWACANHRHLAGDRERARNLSTSCAEHLLEVGLAHDACAAFQRALENCVTDGQRLALLPRLAFAFQLDNEWTSSQTALQKCIELTRTEAQTTRAHNDFELLLLEARHRCSLDFVSLMNETLLCVENQEAAYSHRVRAGVLAMKLATDFGITETIDSIYNHVSPFLYDPTVPESTRLELEIIYRTMRGDGLVPEQDLWDYVNAVRRAEGEAAYSHALNTAASACRISGRYSEGLEFISKASAHAKSQRLYSHMTYIGIAATRVYLLTGCFDKAKAVLTSLRDSPTTSDNVGEQVEIHFMETRIAIEEGDLAAATRAFSAIDVVEAMFSSTRAANYFALGLRIALMQHAAWTEIRVLVEKLERNHVRMRAIGSQDFEVYSLYLGLRALGEGSRAIGLLEEYLTQYRRTKAAIPGDIREVLVSKHSARRDQSYASLADQSPDDRGAATLRAPASGAV